MSRLAAINKEREFLETEVEHVEELIKQYDSSSYYYDIIEEEKRVTDTILNGKKLPEFTLTEAPPRKKQVHISKDTFLYYMELIGQFSAKAFYEVLCVELDSVPNKSTVYARLKHYHTIGILERTKLRPLTYKFIPENANN